MIWDDMHGLNLRTTEDQSHSLRLIPGNDIILIIGFVLAFKRWYGEKQFPNVLSRNNALQGTSSNPSFKEYHLSLLRYYRSFQKDSCTNSYVACCSGINIWWKKVNNSATTDRENWKHKTDWAKVLFEVAFSYASVRCIWTGVLERILFGR